MRGVSTPLNWNKKEVNRIADDIIEGIEQSLETGDYEFTRKRTIRVLLNTELIEENPESCKIVVDTYKLAGWENVGFMSETVREEIRTPQSMRLWGNATEYEDVTRTFFEITEPLPKELKKQYKK